MGSNKFIIAKIKCWPVFKQDPRFFWKLIISPAGVTQWHTRITTGVVADTYEPSTNGGAGEVFVLARVQSPPHASTT